ncbi:MAG: Ig-like domain-containing protein, partial [Actinomycetota bacterium]
MAGTQPIRHALAAALGAASLVAFPGGPAGAADITAPCNAFAVNADGSKGAALPVAGLTQTLPLPSIGAGVTELPAGLAFDLPTGSGPIELPATAPGTPVGDLTILEIKDIQLAFAISGAAAIGTPTLAGGSVLDPSMVAINPTTLRLTLPGSQLGSVSPVAGSAFFPGGSTFQTPSITIPLTTGAVGTTLSGSVASFQVDARVTSATLPALSIRLECTPPANTINSVKIVAPPAPGAPTAVSDVATTPTNTPVVVNVLANDVKNTTLDIDLSSLAITTPPAHGVATKNADNSMTYAPAAGFAGTDTFAYTLCSVASTDPLIPSGCDTADVTITVATPASEVAAAAAAAAGSATTPAAPGAPAPDRKRGGEGTRVGS